ncbi:hypothetical protein [Bacillus cereus]|uniref:hypothetical protein n=1 Tax=Bacillus cereus TaxID=1396 RepID=UPI000BF5DBA0|nr:hypothetical protein [Bacillus cereus]PFR36752.1 hypothetical protein COK20_17455 [Bacillus cereus]PFW23804.1 hypothetical protein COL07_25305 [Bacillus cereus]
MSSVELFRFIEDYYQDWTEKELFNVLKSDDNIFILEKKDSKNRIVVKRESLIPSGICIKKGWELCQLGKCFRNYNYELDNNKMKYSKDKGFYNNDYAEYFFRYFKIEDITVNFKIDDVEFEIGSPSETFKLVFNHISKDEYFEWEHYYTIKLRNVKKETIEDYLQNAIYFVHKYYPSDLFNEHPRILQYKYIDENWPGGEVVDNSILNQNLSLSKYTEALAYYNEGKQKRDFLSFYKILEYFFLINRKDEFKSLILEYNQNEDMDKTLKEITKIYKTNEDLLLEALLNKINNLEPILDKALSKGLISSKDNKKEFAKKLYDYRNSRVHGKKDTNLNLLVPTILDLESNDEWEIVIENVADLVIKQFCYS